MALSRVITRSKRKALNRVKAQMTALRPREDPPDHETMITLMRLWDYHDRIKGTRNTVLDVKGIMNLINTLLIPLLAFLIANREALLELLLFAVAEHQLASELKQPRLRAIAPGYEVEWHYRGQVTPEHQVVRTNISLASVARHV